MKIMITGCNGLLGQNVQLTVLKNTQLLGADVHDRPFVKLRKCNYIQLDITRRKEAREAVVSFKPEWIIHTAAYTDVDRAEIEREHCWNINVHGTDNLAYAAKKVGAKCIHLSTDYIFDGVNGPYDESARPNPQGYYAKSKLAGENALLASDVEFAIVRTMVLYGYGVNIRDNFVTWLIRKLQAHQTVTIVDDQVGNTTLASELAEGIWAIVRSGKMGTYNIAGAEIIDRHAFAQKVAEVFKLDGSLISAIKTDQLHQLAPRPLRSGLKIDRAREELNISMSDATAGLRCFKRQLKSAKSRLI